MTLFGKDIQQLQVMAADFLPDQDQLYFVIADADSNIHVLQYDPESMSNQYFPYLTKFKSFTNKPASSSSSSSVHT